MLSSIIVSLAIFESFINVSITKHKPNRFDDVGKICLDIFFLLSFSTMLDLFAYMISFNYAEIVMKL